MEDEKSKFILHNPDDGFQPNSSDTDILRISIPIFLPQKQKKITVHITAIRLKAQQLKVNTKEESAQASSEIENILLD